MKICGIVAEYNPFHTGHLYQMEQIRAQLGEDCAIVCVMSGNYVQRGDFASFPKHIRAKAALRCGADLILELPLSWSLAPAERFAEGAVEVLHQTGVVEYLSFGSEETNLKNLLEIAEASDSSMTDRLQFEWMQYGFSAPMAKQKAMDQILGEKSEILTRPNAMLAVSYLRGMKKIGASFQILPVLRKGAGHDTEIPDENFASASFLRTCIKKGAWEKAAPFLPFHTLDLFRQAEQDGLGPVFLEEGAGERAILSRLRSLEKEGFQALPEAGGGLSQRIWNAVQRTNSVSDLLQQCKTKRYTYAHLRRLILRASLGIWKNDLTEHIPYLRVLGFSKQGQAVLALMRKQSQCPVVIKFADGIKLGGEVEHHLMLEAKGTDFYGLCTPKVLKPGLEWEISPVRI